MDNCISSKNQYKSNNIILHNKRGNLTMTNKNIVSTHTVKLENGIEVEAYRIKLDSNGNPRYLVHFLSLDIKLADYGRITGLKKYNAKWFGGGYVLESCYNLQEDLQRTYNIAQSYYEKKEGKNAPKYYGTNLHRKGEHKKIMSMERLAIKMQKESNEGLAGAYLTNGYYGADCIGMLANTKEFENKTGYIVYDEALKKAVFLLDESEVN